MNKITLNKYPLVEEYKYPIINLDEEVEKEWIEKNKNYFHNNGNYIIKYLEEDIFKLEEYNNENICLQLYYPNNVIYYELSTLVEELFNQKICVINKVYMDKKSEETTIYLFGIWYYENKYKKNRLKYTEAEVFRILMKENNWAGFHVPNPFLEKDKIKKRYENDHLTDILYKLTMIEIKKGIEIVKRELEFKKMKELKI